MASRSRGAHAKRHGRHQKHTPNFLKVYWPYMPLASILIVGLFFAAPWKTVNSGKNGVLAYATDTTVGGLLQETNNQRTANGQKTLSLNNKLDSAAQAKANDMVTRNYWSHTTPDGQQPWVFINNTGYKYQKAGENLAYGFTTSAYTVAGWMNSPPHRENLLDSAFSDVGFGIANSADYQSTGPETIVVAMYAKPSVLAASNSAAPPAAAAAKKPAATPKSSAPAPAASTPAAVPTTPPASNPATPASPTETKIQPVTTQAKALAEPPTQNISRLQAITEGKMPWLGYATGLISGIGVALVLLKHGWALKRAVINGEKFIYHHALFDITVISFVALCIVSAHSVGFIR